MSTVCATHNRPTSGGAWCTSGDNSCRRTVRTALANVPDYFDDLETVRTRRTRYGDGVSVMGSIGKTQPLGVDARFLPDAAGTRAEKVTQQVVGGYVKRFGELRGQATPSGVRAACDYLADHLADVAAMPWAEAFKTDLLSVEGMLARVVDRPAEAWYAGVCGALLGMHDETTCGCECHTGTFHCDIPGGCGLDVTAFKCDRVLYAEPDRSFVHCRSCGADYPVAERRTALVEEAREHNVTVKTITRIVTTLGGIDVSEERMSARIRQWAHRGRIAAHGTRVVDGRPRPVYRVGDVLDLLVAEEAS